MIRPLGGVWSHEPVDKSLIHRQQAYGSDVTGLVTGRPQLAWLSVVGRLCRLGPVGSISTRTALSAS